MHSYYSSFATLVLIGVFFLGFRSERNIRNDLVRSGTIQEGTSPSSKRNDSTAMVALQMISFEEWLLLHKAGHSRHANDSIQNSFYASPEEFAKRRKIYQENLSRWTKLNRIPSGARYGPEKEPHADRTPHEFAQLVGSCYRTNNNQDETRRNHHKQQVQRGRRDLQTVLRSKKTTATKTATEYNRQTLQQAFTIMDVDWRAHAPLNNRQASNANSTDPTALVSYVTPVKKQGPHGTCWSFAAAENLEGLAVRQGYSLQNISEQEFISCCSDCQGRSADHTFSWLLKATDGVPALEESYPYVGNTSVPCLADTAPRAQVQLHSWSRVEDQDSTGNAIVQALEKYGPMGLGVDAKCFHGYQSGIVRECNETNFDGTNQQPMVNHAVLMVAAGTDLCYAQEENNKVSFPETVNFFAIKNSWGSNWGEDGYVRIERGKNWWGPISAIYIE